MSNSAKKLASSAVASVIVMGIMVASNDVLAAKPGMEKCTGIVKAGMNDCGTSKHSCAGQAAADGGADEWIYVPEGTCTKLVNGKVK